jgi:hypothetical protein
MSIEKQTSASYAIHREMPNGARVSDWLGTAATAASVAGRDLHHVRERRVIAGRELEVLARAERSLVQALEELRAVRSEVER